MSLRRRPTAVPRIVAGVVIVLWFVVAGVGGPLVGQLSSVQDNDQASFLPADAESTQVSARLGDFGADATLPLLLVVEDLSLIHISEPTRPCGTSRMPSSA